jgi:hypothetical protein
MKILFTSILILLNSIVAMAQIKSELNQTVISVNKMKEDFALIREIFETIHPALYDFVPKEQLNQEFDNTGRLLNKEMTILNFYKKISPIIFQLGCGHTAIGLPTREADYIKQFFPFRLKFLRGRAYILETEKKDSLLKGSEVLTINKIPIAQIIKDLFKYTSTDGFNTSNKYKWLDAKFDLYYGLFIAQPDTFNFTLKNKSNKDTKVSLPAALQRVSLAMPMQAGNMSNKKPLPFNLNTINPKVAVLTIDKFYVDERFEDRFDEKIYSRFLDSCFSLIKEKNIKNLVIDLRQNPGGYGTWGAWLYAYLTNKPFNYYKKAIVATNQNLLFLKYTNWTEPEYLDYAKEIVKTPTGGYQWNGHSNLKLQYPKENNFSGSVYVLIGRKCFPTTAEFCAIAHSNKRATFIGEETGGGYYSINGGEMMEVKLPNSKIKLMIPLRKYQLAVKGYPYIGRGTIPNYVVIPTIQQFMNHTDMELKFVLSLINKKS